MEKSLEHVLYHMDMSRQMKLYLIVRQTEYALSIIFTGIYG